MVRSPGIFPNMPYLEMYIEFRLLFKAECSKKSDIKLVAHTKVKKKKVINKLKLNLKMSAQTFLE